MRQKEKEKQHQLLAGEKHTSISRQKEVQPGSDECGEDISSLDCYDDVVDCYYQETDLIIVEIFM